MRGNKVFSGILWRLGERIAAQMVSFVVSVVLARFLLPSEYGIVAIVLIFINIADLFVTSGFSTALIQNKNATKEDFSCALYMSLIMAIFVYAVMFFCAPLIASYYHNDQLVPVVRVFSIKIPIAAYNSIQHAYVSRHMMFKKFFFSTLIGTIISGLVGVIAALKGLGVWALVAQYLTNSIIDTVVLNFTLPWKPMLFFSIERVKPIIRYGSRILAADLVGTIYNNLRGLLIGHYYSSSDLAFYNRGKQLPELISTNLNTSITSVLFPALSNHSDNPEEIKRLTKRAIRTMSCIIWPFMFGLIAIAEPLIIVLFTEKWILAIPLMRILCLSKPLDMITNANLQAIKALGKSDIVLKLEFIKKPIGFAIVFISIHLGVEWIAWSVVIYDIYATIINMIPNARLIHYSIKEQAFDILPFILFSMVMGAVVYSATFLPITNIFKLIIQIPLGMLIYYMLNRLFCPDMVNIVKKMIKIKR